MTRLLYASRFADLISKGREGGFKKDLVSGVGMQYEFGTASYREDSCLCGRITKIKVNKIERGSDSHRYIVVINETNCSHLEY